ncbi:TetR/AcrR family transcriptional regulator [Mycolicibacterium brisbanense]
MSAKSGPRTSAITTPGSAANRRRPTGGAGVGHTRTASYVAALTDHHSSSREFRERGFGGVSFDEFGIAGPAVYRYFESKADILCTLINRVQEWLALESFRATGDSSSDGQVVNDLVRIPRLLQHKEFLVEVIGCSITVLLNTPVPAARSTRRRDGE